jgi:serine/threonine protein kinase
MTQQTNQQLGKYRIIKFLGRGGFADVYLGEHIYLKTQAAIKVMHTHLDSEHLETFRSEAFAVAHLSHPCIIRVLDFDVENYVPFLVMEYAPQGNLRQRHPRGTRVPPHVFMPYVRQIASALQYAHDQKLIHRDVKPENMLVGSSNQILLSDFGTALVSQSTFSQDTEAMVTGTLSYMAPEQIQGKARPASDQYALAVVVYEWLSGTKPFNGSYMEIMAQHLSTPPPPLDEQTLAIPHAVQEVLRRALTKDPHQRFPRVQDFAEALDRAFQMRPQSTVAAPRSSVAHQPLPSLPVPPMRQNGRPVSSHAPTIYATPPVKGREPASKIKKGLKRGFGILAVTVALVGVLVCGLGFAAYHFFISPQTSTVANTAGATALANDFVQAISSRNYDQAYNDLGPPVTGQTSRTQFTQQAQSEDRCYGVITSYKNAAPTTQGSALTYTYTMNRARRSQPYQLSVTLQQNSAGTWQITDYNSNVDTGQPPCP